MFFGPTHPTDLGLQTDDVAARLSIANCCIRERDVKYVECVEVALRWRVTFRPRIVNIIVSYDEGGAHDTTQYMAMEKIEFRIFAQNF